mmetsp:Transcript_7871/g.24149  ORF Transcript_7871/g.24149 Transcript_7871/m.24149 type:complete len:440 (-) Transcript_7871:90-1409(-)
MVGCGSRLGVGPSSSMRAAGGLWMVSALGRSANEVDLCLFARRWASTSSSASSRASRPTKPGVCGPRSQNDLAKAARPSSCSSSRSGRSAGSRQAWSSLGRGGAGSGETGSATAGCSGAAWCRLAGFSSGSTTTCSGRAGTLSLERVSGLDFDKSRSLPRACDRALSSIFFCCCCWWCCWCCCKGASSSSSEAEEGSAELAFRETTGGGVGWRGGAVDEMDARKADSSLARSSCSSLSCSSSTPLRLRKICFPRHFSPANFFEIRIAEQLSFLERKARSVAPFSSCSSPASKSRISRAANASSSADHFPRRVPPAAATPRIFDDDAPSSPSRCRLHPARSGLAVAFPPQSPPSDSAAVLVPNAATAASCCWPFPVAVAAVVVFWEAAPLDASCGAAAVAVVVVVVVTLPEALAAPPSAGLGPVAVGLIGPGTSSRRSRR